MKLNWKKDEVNSVCFSHYANSFYKEISELSDSEKEQLSDYTKMFSGVTEMHIDSLKNNKKIYHEQIGAHLGYGVEESAVVTGKMY